MRKISWINLIGWVIAFEAIGFLLGQLTQVNLYPWYEGLNKSSLTPPGVIFSIVWSTLYAVLAIVALILSNYRHNRMFKSIFYLFWVQMFMNWTWTLLFFQLHWVGLSVLWLVVITCLNAVIIFSVKNKDLRIAILLIPYFFWLLFATYLNTTIWILN